MTMLIGHFLALCIGVSLGLLGGGGSVLALPILVYVMGIPTKSAIAMTLIIVGTVSLLGTLPHWLRGNIHLKMAAGFGAATMLGAYGGAKLATTPWVTETFQMVLFASLMLLAAGLMIRRNPNPGAIVVSLPGEIAAPVTNCAANVCPTADPSTHPSVSPKLPWGWLLVEGVGVGVLTGLVGVGGGFAIVPALVLLGNIPIKQAIATSLLIIAGNATAGLAGYLGKVPIDWALTVSFTFAAGAGTVAGSYLGQYVSAKHLQRGFGYFLFAIAAFILAKTYAVQ